MGTYMYPVTLLTEFTRARGALPAPFFTCPNGKLMPLGANQRRISGPMVVRRF